MMLAKIKEKKMPTTAYHPPTTSLIVSLILNASAVSNSTDKPAKPVLLMD